MTMKFLSLLLLLAPSIQAQDAPARIPSASWLRYAEAEQAGFSSEKLLQAQDYFEQLDAAAALVIYDGAVLAAWGDVERRYMCHSVRKSFMSGMFGVLDDAGELDLDAAIGDLGIDDMEPGLTDVEKGATVLNLLQARSGVYRLAAYEPPQNPKPPRHSHEPGTFWCYNNWDFNTLVTIFEQQTGKRFFEEFDARIARPIGMQDYRPSDGYLHYELDKSIHPAYPFRMSARDMARFGLLYLNRGHWGDEQVISESWVDRSQEAISEAWQGDSYGLLWWISGAEPFSGLGMYSALGSGGHAIDVLPGANLVLAFRVDTYDRKQVSPDLRKRLLGMILDARVGEPVEEPLLVPLVPLVARAPEEWPALENPERHVGQYSDRDGEPHEVRLDAELGLVVELQGLGNFRLFPVDETHFELEDLESQVVLELDAAGRPARIHLELFSHMEIRYLQRQGQREQARAVAERRVERFPSSGAALRILAELQ